jgi:hypothetical protein
MKYLFALLALLVTAAAVSAQSTTVSGTITDANSQAFANGTYSISLNTNGRLGPFTWNGSSFSATQSYSGNLDNTGSFSLSLPSSGAISPIGTIWTFSVCPAASANCYSTSFAVNGATLNVSTLITPPAIQVPAKAFNQALAYSDSEITGQILGFTYFNLNDNTLHLCTVALPCTWVSVSGGGGGSPDFSTILSGTNTSAAMLVGSGASLGVTGSGTIGATTLLGHTWAAPGTIGGTTPGAATFSSIVDTGISSSASPICPNGSGGAFTTTGCTGGTTTNALTMNNTGSGASSGATFNGGAAVTLSYNTLGASPLAGSTSLTTLGTIGTGTWQGTSVGTGFGGTGQAWNSSNGIPQLGSGAFTLYNGSCSSGSSALTWNNSTETFGCNTISGSGTVNSGTANHIAYYASSGTAVSSDANLDDGATAVNTLTYVGSGGVTAPVLTASGTNGGMSGGEGTGALLTPASGVDLFYPDSTNHCWHQNLNNTDVGCTSSASNTLTLTNKTISGSSNTLSNIGNSSLSNSAITIAGTSVSLGGSTSSLPSPGAIGGTTPAAITGTTITVNTGLVINGSTAITSTSSANSQAVTCATGGSGTQVCDAAGSWISGSTTVGGVTCTLGSTCFPSDTTFTVGTTAIAANTCTSASTVTMTGLTTAMAFSISPSADVSGVTGWGSTGGLVIDAWPTSNTLNYKVCNQTAASITPSASVTFNVAAR